MNGTVTSMYFSPTLSSGKITRKIAESLAVHLEAETATTDLTRPEDREQDYLFGKEDILVFGFPVYAGRIPLVLEQFLSRVRGDGTCAVIVAVYGNRDYDDALLEAKELLTQNGFVVIAAGAFIAQHCIAEKLAKGRPDRSDLTVMAEFARDAAEKIAAGNRQAVAVKGHHPYRERGPASPLHPATSDDCIDCKLCAERCPVGIISYENPSNVEGQCINCFACVRACPVGAKSFEAPAFKQLVEKLEANFMARREPELFLQTGGIL